MPAAVCPAVLPTGEPPFLINMTISVSAKISAAANANEARYPNDDCIFIAAAGPIAIASALIVPYNPMPAPIREMGIIMVIHVAIHTDMTENPTPFIVLQIVKNSGVFAKQHPMFAARSSEDEPQATARLENLSERMPANGRQKSEIKLMEAAMAPVADGEAPSSAANPAVSDIPIIEQAI